MHKKFDDVLIYTDGKYSNPQISKVLRLVVDNPDNDGYTYITDMKEVIKSGEQSEIYGETSIDDQARALSDWIRETTGRKITFTKYENPNIDTNAKNVIQRTNILRTRTNYHFENNIESRGNIGEGENSKGEVNYRNSKFSLKESIQDSSSEELKNILQDKGINYVEYKDGNETYITDKNFTHSDFDFLC